MDIKRKVEAVLFSSGRRMTTQEIAKIVKLPPTIVEEALKELLKEYSQKDSSIILENEGNDWRLTVREEHLDLVKDLVPTTELPKAVTETLAVIAYKQPILQSVVVKIRGNKAYDHIEALIDAELITKEKKGRSFLIKITPKFLDYFELPKSSVKEVIDSKLQEKGLVLNLETYGEREEDKEDIDTGEKLGNLEIFEEEPNKKNNESGKTEAETKEEDFTEVTEKPVNKPYTQMQDESNKNINGKNNENTKEDADE